MDEDHYKKVYDEEYEKSKKLIAFIESLESLSDNWDDFCDSGCDGVHAKDCMTSKIRMDRDALY